MLPKDVAGVFSRFFISGFFLPAFFTLFVLWLTASAHFQPASFAAETRDVQVLVLGGLALLIGLLLQGLRFPLLRIFEGYGIQYRLLLRPVHWLAMPLQRWSYRRIVRQAGTEEWKRDWLLDRRFPRELDRLLPTRFGNALRAYEDHSYTRWGLDMMAIYPRVDALLTEREQELHWNAYTDVMLFLNLTLGAVAVGMILVADEIAHDRLSGWTQVLYAAPFLLAYLLYRFAVGAVERWGTERKASIDLHRLDLYKALGVRNPLTSADERDKIAPAVNDLLLYGHGLPDSMQRLSAAAEEEAPGEPRRPRPAPVPQLPEESPGEPRRPEPAPGEPEESPEESPGEPRALRDR
jgi:hypothetical protein